MRKLLKLSSLQFSSWKNAKKQRKYLKNWSKLRFALQLVLRENFQKRWCRGKSNLSKRPLSRKQKVERPSKLNSKVLTESSKVRKKSFLARSRKFLHFRFWPKKLFFLTLEASVSTFDNKFVAHFTSEKLGKEIFWRPALRLRSMNVCLHFFCKNRRLLHFFSLQKFKSEDFEEFCRHSPPSAPKVSVIVPRSFFPIFRVQAKIYPKTSQNAFLARFRHNVPGELFGNDPQLNFRNWIKVFPYLRQRCCLQKSWVKESVLKRLFFFGFEFFFPQKSLELEKKSSLFWVPVSRYYRRESGKHFREFGRIFVQEICWPAEIQRIFLPCQKKSVFQKNTSQGIRP